MTATARDLFTKRPRAVDRAPPPREVTLHFAVAKLLDDYAHPDWLHSHFPAGEERDDRTAAKLKRMGLKRGWPDFVLIAPWGLLHALELKRVGEDLTEDQDAFQAWCLAHNVPHALCRTMDEVLAVFGRWGCLRFKVAGGAR